MKRLTENKPPNGSLLTGWQVRVDTVYQILGPEEDRCADGREDGEKDLHRPFVGEIVCDFDFEGVERVVRDAEGGRIDGLHD